MTDPIPHAYSPISYAGRCTACGHGKSHPCHQSMPSPEPYVCPGCAVREFWEHRCCRDEEDGRMCECPECQPTPAREAAVSAAETGAAEIDLAHIEFHPTVGDVVPLVREVEAQWRRAAAAEAAVEALRQRVAEMERICVTVSDKNDELHARTEAGEAHAVELAEACTEALDALETLARHKDTNWWCKQLRTALASTPAKALERARAKDECVEICRDFVRRSDEADLDSPHTYRCCKTALITLDALQPAKEDAS